MWFYCYLKQTLIKTLKTLFLPSFLSLEQDNCILSTFCHRKTYQLITVVLVILKILISKFIGSLQKMSHASDLHWLRNFLCSSKRWYFAHNTDNLRPHHFKPNIPTNVYAISKQRIRFLNGCHTWDMFLYWIPKLKFRDPLLSLLNTECQILREKLNCLKIWEPSKLREYLQILNLFWESHKHLKKQLFYYHFSLVFCNL